MASKYNENVAAVKVAKTNDKGEADEKLVILVETGKKDLQTQIDETIKDAEAKGATAELVKTQTFQITQVDNWDEAAELVPNEAARLAQYNRGCVLYQQSARNTFMKDEDQDAVEGVYDLLQDIQEPKERRKADPKKRILKDFADLGISLTPDQFDSILAQFQVSA